MAAVERHPARRAQPHAPVPRQVGRAARARLRRPPLLPGAAGRRRARLQGARGAGRRGPARAPGAHARHGGALQQALRRAARRARAPDPRRSARACATCRSPSARCRRPAATEQGTVYVLDEPDDIRRKFKRAVADSGREIVRARRQARHLEPDRDHGRGPRRRARGDRARVRRLRLRRLQGRGGRGRDRVARPRCASATTSCGPTPTSSRASSRPAPTRRARSRAARSRRCARRWAWARVKRSVGPPA